MALYQDLKTVYLACFASDWVGARKRFALGAAIDSSPV